MKKQMEKPFEHLRRKDGSKFSTETIQNWYIARAYVLDKLKDIAFSPDSKDHLHVVVTNDSPLMLSVVRQVALCAHYLNFDENTGKQRTLITLLSKNAHIIQTLMEEEYLCNLLMLCKYSVNRTASVNDNSYVDIELQITEDLSAKDKDDAVIMTEEEANAYREQDIYCINTRKAVYTSRMYQIGATIDNLPYEDIHDAKRYSLALDLFQFKKLYEPMTPLIDTRKEYDFFSIKILCSNIFCSDCFESRANGVRKCKGKDIKSEKKCWESLNEPLSKSEHARWVAERLIMGFRPPNLQERYRDEELFGDAKSQYRKQLKNNAEDPVHVDICSYADLRRINPDNLKYDSILMLAIPEILRKATEDEKL